MQFGAIEFITKIPYLPAVAGVVALVAVAVCLFRFRVWAGQFSFFDAVLVMIAMSTGGLAVAPLVEGGRESASAASALETLRVLRNQIELYRVQHNGAPPVLFKGTFPQLTHSTNGAGLPGSDVRKFPLGPYVAEIPANPLTSVATITATPTATPTQASPQRGWLYHQASGRIFLDLPEYLNR